MRIIVIDFRKSGFEDKNQYDFPNIINICVLRGECPCNCTHCPVGIVPPSDRREKFGNGILSMELFEKIAAEMSRFPHSTLRIHSVGEPLLWKHLTPAVTLAKKLNITSWLFTSLITQDKDLLESITKNCNIIEVSVNDIDAGEYEKNKGVRAFDTVFNNLRFIDNLRKKNRLSVRIIVSRVESESRTGDTGFVDFWKKSGLVDDAFIRSYHNYNWELPNKFNAQVREITRCIVHWQRFNIDSDGSAVLCFNELFKGQLVDKSLILGDIALDSIARIWHCDRLEQVRTAQINKDYSQVTFTDILPCPECCSCQPPAGEKRHTSEHQLELLRGK